MARRTPVPLADATDARGAALSVLVRVEAGAFAGPALDGVLARIDRRDDRALCTELVYGTLRRQGQIDHVLGAFLRQPIDRLPAAVRAALRLGVYQILHLERVPAHAAVSTSVDLAARAGAGGLGGVVNGVLRRLLRDGMPPLPAEPVAALSVETSHPRWLVSQWLSQYGEARARALLDYDNRPAPLTVRVRPGVGRESLRARWQESGIEAEPTHLSAHGLRLLGGHSVPSLPGYDEGAFVVQDEAAMLAVEWLHAQAGERVIDACAGRGTKTLGLLDAVGADGAVLAVDLHAGKIGALGREARRRGHAVSALAEGGRVERGLGTVTADARTLPALVGAEGAGRILLDAPCSGLGVLRRRPELRWRRTEQDAAELAALQRELLMAAIDALRPGGEVLYVTCTTDPREDEAVVGDVLSARSDATAAAVAPQAGAGPGVESGEAGTLRLFGPESGTDSFFYARIRRDAI